MNVRTSVAIAIALALSTGLTGCEGCAADRSAHAQVLDAGMRTPNGYPLPGPAGCYLAAQERTNLLDLQAYQLCQGAPTPMGPIDCFVESERRLMLTDAQSLLLCRCAASSQPVECFEMLDESTRLTDPEIQELCSPTLSLGLLASCYPRAA